MQRLSQGRRRASNQDFEAELEALLRRLADGTLEQDALLQLAREKQLQEQSLQDRLQERLRRRRKNLEEGKDADEDPESRKGYEDDLDEMLRRAKEFIENSEHLSQRQKEILLQRSQMLDKIRERKKRRQ